MKGKSPFQIRGGRVSGEGLMVRVKGEGEGITLGKEQGV